MKLTKPCPAKLFHHAIAIFLSLASCLTAYASTADDSCDDCMARFAIKTNLVHDALLTPDLGVEIGIAKKFSLSVEGVWARWGNSSSSKCWHIWGGWMEARYWPFRKSRLRALAGHHFGIYGGMHQYDFSLGRTGRQSLGWTYSYGVSYGYSFPIGPRLNLDLSMRIGYYSSSFEKYRFMCGTPVGERISSRKFFGPTDLAVSLVWFPGWDLRNRPNF